MTKYSRQLMDTIDEWFETHDNISVDEYKLFRKCLQVMLR